MPAFSRYDLAAEIVEAVNSEGNSGRKIAINAKTSKPNILNGI